MSEAGGIFENLYRQFILRDLFAKIMPGFIVIISTAHFLCYSIKKLFYLTAKFVFWQWLLLFSFAWIIGFIVQHAGILVEHLADETHRLIKEKEYELLKGRFRKKYDIAHFASDEFKKVLERAVVIKEACGNTSFALLYAAGLLVVHFWLNIWKGHCPVISLHAAYSFLVTLSMVGLSWILWRAHWYHAQREELFRKTFYILPCQKND